MQKAAHVSCPKLAHHSFSFSAELGDIGSRQDISLTWVRNVLKSGRQLTRIAGTKSSARHRSVQPIIIARKARKFLKSANRNFREFEGRKGTQFRRGPPVSVGRWAILRVPDQQGRDAKAHQRRSDAFEG